MLREYVQFVTVYNDNCYNSVVADDHKETVFVCKAGVVEDATLYRHRMKVEHGFTIFDIEQDGNCVFSAFSLPSLHRPTQTFSIQPTYF